MARASTARKSKAKKKPNRKRSKLPSRKKKTKAKKKKTKSKKSKKTAKKKVTKKRVTKKKLNKKSKSKKKKTKTASKKRSATKAKAKTTRPISANNTQNLPPPLAVVENQLGKGDMAPDFQLPDQNGSIHSLSQYRGKNVLLYFYPKDDTPGCTKEACSFRDQILDIGNLNTVILGVSFDDAESHQKFIEKYNLNFTLLSDSEKETAQAYGVYVEKNMYGRSYMGIERSTFVIDAEGRIAAAFRGVRVDGHTEEVLEELQKLS